MLGVRALGGSGRAVRRIPAFRARRGRCGTRPPTNIYPAPAATAIAAAIVPNFFGNPSHGDYFTHYNRHGMASNFCEQQMYPGHGHVGAGHRGVPCMAPTLARAHAGGVRRWSSAALMFGVPVRHGAVSTRAGSRRDRPDPLRPRDDHRRDHPGGGWRRSRWHASRSPIPRRGRGCPDDCSGSAPPSCWSSLPGCWGPGARCARNELLSQTLGWSAWALVLTTGASALVWARLTNRVGARAFTTIAIALVVVDLFALAWRFHPMIPRDSSSRRAGDRDRSKPIAVSSASSGCRDAMAAECRHGVRAAGPARLRRRQPGLHADLVGTAHKGGSYRIVRPGDPFHVLDLMNVKYIFAAATRRCCPRTTSRVCSRAGRSALYRNDRVFPRAFLVSRARVAEKRAGACDRCARSRWICATKWCWPSRCLRPMRPDAVENGREGCGAGHALRRRARRDRDRGQRPARARAGRFRLSRLDRAIDGAPVPLVRANRALRGVSVPAGRHRVSFHFDPLSVRLGAWLSLAGDRRDRCNRRDGRKTKIVVAHGLSRGRTSAAWV